MKTIFKQLVTVLLSFACRILLWRHRPYIIAITGNVGKTTTKDAVYEVVSKKFHARKSDKSFNSEIGVPLTILGLNNAWSDPLHWAWNIVVAYKRALFSRTYPECLVLEVGADHPHDIETLTKWLKPNISIITHIPNVPVHVEFFGSPERLVEEKRFLAKSLRPHGTLIVDADSPYSLNTKKVVGKDIKVISFGVSDQSDVRLVESHMLFESSILTGQTLHVSWDDAHVKGRALTHGQQRAKDNMSIIENIGTIGEHRAQSMLAAIAVGVALTIPREEIIDAIEDMEITKGRMRLLKGVHGSTIIDDSYNASPIATEGAIQTLKKITTQKDGKKILVLGDMLELGNYSNQAHKEIGNKVVGNADMLCTVGIRARDIAQGAMQNGFDKEKIKQFDSSMAAGKYIREILREDDIVLFKGSQGIRIEKAVAQCLSEDIDPHDALVRHDKVWKMK